MSCPVAFFFFFSVRNLVFLGCFVGYFLLDLILFLLRVEIPRCDSCWLVLSKVAI